jgi:ribosomal protein S18 acetylase RimI-like enzyme
MRKLSSRHASAGDAEAILAVGIARDIADTGAPDWTLEDVREEMDGAVRAWVVEDPAGTVIAAALLEGDGFARVIVHPEASGRGAGTLLREAVEAAAPPGAVLRQEVQGANEAARALLEAAGYEAAQHYWRMAMSLVAVVPEAEWPAEVVTGPYLADDPPEAEKLVRASIPDLSGGVAARRIAPELSIVARAEADGSLAGVALCERRDDEGHGYVAYLAVAPGWRGRGLGRALLAAALERMRSAGLERAALGVNGRNSSATALYESLGMRAEWRADRYDKQLPSA